MAGYGLKIHQPYRVRVQAETTGGYGPMGFGLRIFFVGAGDSVRHFPVTSGIMRKDGRSP
jgi:hypothetical protein